MEFDQFVYIIPKEFNCFFQLSENLHTLEQVSMVIWLNEQLEPIEIDKNTLLSFLLLFLWEM